MNILDVELLLLAEGVIDSTPLNDFDAKKRLCRSSPPSVAQQAIKTVDQTPLLEGLDDAYIRDMSERLRSLLVNLRQNLWS
jgi:hypothetical protein